MACADCNHDRSGLSHPLLDPPRPVGVSALEKRVPKLGRYGEVTIERLGDRTDVTAGPGAQHGLEVLVHARRLFDGSFQKRPLRLLGKRVEKAQLLAIALKLADRLALVLESVAQNELDTLAGLQAHAL